MYSMPAPFRIKICGITSVEDALAAVEAGADALGLNFYPQSSRFVTADAAAKIAAAAKRRVKLVGVFVNATAEEIQAAVSAGELDAVQLHGDESPEFVGRMKAAHSQVLRAFRVRGDSLGEVEVYLRATKPDAVLLDAYDPKAYGGTGKRLDWDLVRRERSAALGLPIILAGGLTAENVAEAIETARPDAVDVAGGVESAPGRKDAEKVRRFVAAAQKAFDRLGLR